MPDDRLTFAFDFVDPGSYLVRELLVRWLGPDAPTRVHMTPLELRPPPEPLISPADPGWRALSEAMAALAHEVGIGFVPPELVPWSRKAHELLQHGREHGDEREPGSDPELVDRIFRARFQEGRDLGRVDVLVELAQKAGLDGPEARTVLGVDRFSGEVARLRRWALETGIRGVPTLLHGPRRLEGLRSVEELRAFLREGALVNR